jgi:hypothetical protein
MVFQNVSCIQYRWLASRVSPSEREKEPLVSTSQGYCSTNLLAQEVSQHIALYVAELDFLSKG